MRKVLGLATAAVLAIMAGNAVAAEIEVKMLNKGAEGVMVFEPALVKIAPGDTSSSSPPTRAITQRRIKGMLPADATPFVGKNGEDVAVTFDKAGIYGVKCLPHYGMGMVAMVVVGTPANIEAGQGRSATRQGQAGDGRTVRAARGADCAEIGKPA